jgi:phosphoenolpyruvate synthase/pyruvate phosphate dikinase
MSSQNQLPGDADATERWVVSFGAIALKDLPKVGGKGANLGELARAGFPVPDGFCVTTDAFRVFLDGAGDTTALFARLAALSPEDTEAVRHAGEETRALLQRLPVPERVADAVERAWRQAGADHFYAVRSSATAEDLPTASFAGQQESYLNVRGKEALLRSVRDCGCRCSPTAPSRTGRGTASPTIASCSRWSSSGWFCRRSRGSCSRRIR